MPEKIEISRFNFWVITTVLGILLVGVGGWATSMNSQMVKQQISMAEMKTIVLSMDTRLKENLTISDRINKMESDLRAFSVRSEANTEDLMSRRGIRFNMPDYDKYVRPIQESLQDRVTRLEAKLE